MTTDDNNDYLDYFNMIFENDALFEDFAGQLEGLTRSLIYKAGNNHWISDLETQMLQNKPLVKKTVTPKFQPQENSPNDLFMRYWVHP